MFRSVKVVIVVAVAAVAAYLIAKPYSEQPASTAEAAKGYCDNPKPKFTIIPGKPPLVRRPAAKVFAEFDAMETQFHKTGVKGLTLAKTGEMVEQLLEFHGEPECAEAEKRLYMARVIDRAVSFAHADAVREQEIKKAEAEHQQQVKNDSAGRIAFASQMERKFLSEGQDFTIQASGDKATTLRIKWVLIGRPFVYKITNEGDFLANIKKRGFKTVIFTDGYNSTWTYDLTK